MEVSDFTTDYQVLTENAMKFDLGDYYLYTMGGASGGPVVGLISNLLEGLYFMLNMVKDESPLLSISEYF